MAGLLSPVRRAFFNVPFYTFLFVVYALAVAGHQFYLRTGTIQDAEAVGFALKEFAGIQGVLATGIDLSF